MISGWITVVTFLSVTFFCLGYYLLLPYSQEHDGIVDGTVKESNIRIHPLGTLDEFPANDNFLPFPSTSSVLDSDLAGQELELDQAHSLQIKMYGNRAFIYEQYSFDSSEKVFLVMEFNQLEAGEHNIEVLWKDPNDRLVNISRHSVSLIKQSRKHRTYFWLKLMKNGMFTEMMTGAEYKGEIHGLWDAEIYFDGGRITTQHFIIYN